MYVPNYVKCTKLNKFLPICVKMLIGCECCLRFF